MEYNIEDVKARVKAKMFLTLGAGLAALTCYGAKKTEQPNIVFILADDLGYGDVSALNENSKIKTPSIDALADNGVVFTDCHSSSSVSTPTRYGILTGRYNWRSKLKKGVLNGYSPPLIPSSRTTMASMLKKSGYNTACIGKWHLGWTWDNIKKGNDSVNFSKPITDGPVSLGFDYFYGFSASLDMPPYVYVENNMPTALPDRKTSGKGMQMWREGPTASDFNHRNTLSHLVDKAVEYIENQSDNKYFYLYLPLPAPHTPILPSENFAGKSGLNPYGDFVMEVDFMVGRIVKALQDNGLYDNTLIVFTSDNGCSPAANIEDLQALGHNPSCIYRGHKADLYEGGHRIPCIMTWGKLLKHRKINQTVCLTDFFSTFASMTGYTVKDDEGEDSYDLSPILFPTFEDIQNGIDTDKKIVREATVHHSINGNFTIRSGEWKLLLAPSSGGWSYPRPDRDTTAIATLPEIQLYNIKNDPAETTNVYAEHPEVVDKLRNILNGYIRNGRSTPGKPQKNS
ncbi:MAG: arylsulfatase [Tannerella sp.]|nr:arylsulfatase [Tannerella sp.]